MLACVSTQALLSQWISPPALVLVHAGAPARISALLYSPPCCALCSACLRSTVCLCCCALDIVTTCVHLQREYLKERETERCAKRLVRVKIFPMVLYIAFILAALLYCYVRIVHGMGGLTLPLIIYSSIVLFVEMLGALNMVFYGCWLFAKPVNSDVFPRPDPHTGKEAPFRRNYNVRVLIPCYKESLAIIQRTVLAAKRADRPPGTSLTIYVCDDGEDEKKLAWVQRMHDPEVRCIA
jgi:hypothetical protein